MASPTPLPHKLTLEERKRLSLTGATEVVRFDDEVVELNTGLGLLVVQGHDLKLKCLSVDDGAVVIHGSISAMSYEEPRQRRGFFR